MYIYIYEYIYIYIYIYSIYIRKLPCSDVQRRENDKADAWNPCNDVHLGIQLHVFRANPCIIEFGQVRANPCNGGSVQIRAMGALCLAGS